MTRKLRFHLGFLLALFVMAVVGARSSFSAEPDFLVVGAGIYDINDDKTAPEFRGEYRSSLRFWNLAPFVGFAGTTDETIYGYGGFGLDIYLGNRLVITPSAAILGYSEGDGKNLGGEFQFRTGAEAAWRFNDWSRIGIGFYHLSNAGIYASNPGTEILGLTYAIPFVK